MTTSHEIQDRIEALTDEAINHHDDAQKLLCERATGYELYDSDTSELLDPSELFPSSNAPMVLYVGTIIESLECDQAEGHVLVEGRRVSAQ